MASTLTLQGSSIYMLTMSLHNLVQIPFTFVLVCPKGYRVNDAHDGCTICPNNTSSDTIDAELCKLCVVAGGITYYPSGVPTTDQVSGEGSTSSSDCRKKLILKFQNQFFITYLPWLANQSEQNGLLSWQKYT